jgi:RimJ/RimL family protein N-acetyltransferase
MTARDLSSLFQLRLRTPRLELRLPSEEELVELAGLVVEQGVHPRDQMPFLVPWTDDIGSASFIDDFVAYHRELRASWRPEDWALELGVWAEDSLLGIQGIHAEDFRRRRTVASGSWLARSFQRRGCGTEMRAAVLELAFSGLGAVAAESGALEGNVASARISEKFGYAEAGENIVQPRGVPVREQRFRLERERWALVEHPPVEITGLEQCLPLFGLGDGGRESEHV